MISLIIHKAQGIECYNHLSNTYEYAHYQIIRSDDEQQYTWDAINTSTTVSASRDRERAKPQR